MAANCRRIRLSSTAFMRSFLLFMAMSCLSSVLPAQNAGEDFDPGLWDLNKAKTVDHLGRKAIMGYALLKEGSLKDGVIEVDIATTRRTRSYPGVLFRVRDPQNFERVYIRPHRSPFYDDALQYAPVLHGVDSWQLHNGEGQTASLDILPDRWNHLKIVVSGTQAHLFWNDEPKPALIIENLTSGISAGGLGVSGPLDQSAFFSNFSYREESGLHLPPSVPREPMLGVIRDWEITEPFSMLKTDLKSRPNADLIEELTWRKVQSDNQGLVDISRFHERKNRFGDLLLARTVLESDRQELVRTAFGYSDIITVFLNDQPVFFGNSAYQSRDRSFLGIVGYNDTLFLPLNKGKNRLMILSAEGSGGWAFCFRKEDTVWLDPSLCTLWSLNWKLAVPEAVVYDPEMDLFYVSNYYSDVGEFISKISPKGEVVEREWVKGLRMPTGMCISGHFLYVVDRAALNLINRKSGAITRKIPLSGILMPNDVSLDQSGKIYISDSKGNAVFRYTAEKLESWLENLDGPNALLVDGESLFIGQKEALLRARLSDGSLETVTRFEKGSLIDGIQKEGNGRFLVSNHFGRLYRVDQDGKKTLLIDTFTPGEKIADFCYLPEKRMLVIPTFDSNSLCAFAMTKD